MWNRNFSGILIFSILLLIPPANAGDNIDYPKEIEQILSSKDKVVPETFRKLIREWTEKNPEEALDWIIRLYGKENFKSAAFDEAEKVLVKMAIERGQRDPEAALKWIREKKGFPSIIYQRYLSGVYNGWAKLDMNAAANAALTEKGDLDKYSALAGIAVRLVKDSPSDACKWALALDPKVKKLIVGTVASIWAKETPDAAFEWVSGLDDADLKKAVLTSLVSSLSKENPQAAAKLLQTAKSDDRMTFYTVTGKLFKRDPKAAREWVLSLPPGEGRISALNGLLHAISKDNPREAAALIPLFPEGESRVKACGDLASSWAEKDWDAAAKWLLSLKDEKEKKKAIDDAALSLSSDPEKGKKWALSFPEGELCDYAVKEFAESWAAFNNTSDAVKWVISLPDGKAKQMALEAITSSFLVWEKNSPEKALEWVSLIPPGKYRNSAFIALAAKWYRTSPEEASEWMDKIPEAHDRTSAVSGKIFFLFTKDIREAEKFIYTFPEDSFRAKSFFMLAAFKADKNEKSAQEWALSLKSRTDRTGAMAGLSIVASQDKNACDFNLEKAIAWIRSQKMAEADKELSVKILKDAYADAFH